MFFNRNKKTDITAAQEALKKAYSELDSLKPDTDEYAKALKQIVMLEKVVSEQCKKERLFKPDTLLMVGANLVGILLILNFEKADSVTSKALGFVSKPRL